MAVAALIISLAAIGIAGLSAWYTYRQTAATERADLRARQPVLTFTLVEKVSAPETRARYVVENRGGEDLDSVVVSRPETADLVRYPVARLGGDEGDEAELGPLEMKAKQELVLFIGPGEDLPEFRVRYTCSKGKHRWVGSEVLEDPRFRMLVY